MDGQPIMEIERPRSAFQLIAATFDLYRRFPWLFLTLAGVVIVPYELLVSISSLGIVHGVARALLGLAFSVADVALVLPLISALHIYAVDDVREGRPPAIRSVGRRGVATLSVVSPAVFLSWLGITVGLAALIVPGVILYLRWAVVAQTGSLAATSWEQALERSKLLTRGHYEHVFGFGLLVLVITLLPAAVLFPIFGLKTTVASFLIRAVIAIPISSFTALSTALLYFDLSARVRTEGASRVVELSQGSGAPVFERQVAPTGHPLDPASWSDEDRPPGWYIDPESAGRMRYWGADGTQGWSKRTTRTPRQTLNEWDAYRKAGRN
jgi:hypothetical protein